MTHRTVICVLLVAVVGVALACGRVTEGDPIPQAQEVRAPEVETPDEAAKQYEAPPATPATAEPSKVEEVEPAESTQPDEPELVTTTFPPLGMQFSVPPYHGPATMERRIADADIIAIVSLASPTSAVETYTHEGQTGYVGALKFTFTVEELIKSPAGSSPTQMVAMVGSLQAYAERSDAQAEAEKMARERDTQWDDRQAIVFLATHSLRFPGSLSDDLYFMSYIDLLLGLGDRYSIASIRNQLWLPEARDSDNGGGNTARKPQERRFLTGVPQQVPDTSPRAATVSTQTETPSITLSDFKAAVSRIEAELAGRSEGYQVCVRANYERLQKAALSAARGRVYMSPETFTAEISSGEKAGTEIIYNTRKIVLGPNGWESRSELLGSNAALFRFGETTKSDTYTYGALNSINAFKSDPELVWHVQPMETVRPLSSGFYSFTWKYHRAEFVLCQPNLFYNHTVNVTVTAPSGVLHELLFDPVTDGSAVAADSSNGQLEPAAFTDANGASATIQRIEWVSDTVKVKVSPHTGLAGHKLDFIELDGSVSLSLVVDEATVDAAKGTLSWTVAEQPWHDGDLLMLRIREAPLRPPPAAPVAPVLSNNDLPLSAQQDATTPIAMSRSNSVYGPTTFEERAIRSDLVIRARLQSKAVSSRWEQSNSLGRKVYFPSVDFTFEVLEVIRGSAGTSVVVELWASKPFYPQFGEGLDKTAAESEQRARDWLSSEYYDSQWEDRDAILFLMDITKTEAYGLGGRPRNVQYAFVGHTGKEAIASNGKDDFSIASENNKAWLPANETRAGATTFYLESPDTDGDAATSSLSTLKSSVTTAASQIDTSKDGYQECLVAKKYDERESTERDVLRVEVTIESGLPTGTIVADRVGLGSNTYWYYHLYGDDAVYFNTSVVDADDNPENGYDGSTRTVRPLPAGQYALEEARQLEVMVPCGYIPDERVHWTINVAAPEGTLHELFFDPVTVGSTVAADGANGVLELATLTDANGGSATISSISYESGTAEVEVTPGDALDGHILDIIELDGTLSLSLDVADATVDAANDTLSWSMSEQPWEDGDKLMVRIRKAR